MTDEVKQGNERTPYVTLGRAVSMKRGIAFLTRVRWRRSADSSRERNDSPGNAGRLRTGRSSAGDDDIQKSEVLVMRTATTVLNIIQLSRLSRCYPYRTANAAVFKDWSPESHVRRKRSCVVRRRADRKVLHQVTRWRPSLLHGDRGLVVLK